MTQHFGGKSKVERMHYFRYRMFSIRINYAVWVAAHIYIDMIVKNPGDTNHSKFNDFQQDFPVAGDSILSRMDEFTVDVDYLDRIARRLDTGNGQCQRFLKNSMVNLLCHLTSGSKFNKAQIGLL